MIKTIGCLLILAASTFGGFAYAESFKKKVRQLNELERAINQLENEIEYTYTPLPEALQSVSEKCEEPVKSLFTGASKLLGSNEAESVYDAFKQCLGKSNMDISKEDINVILDLSKSLGESDVEGHKKMFLLAKSNIKKRISIAEDFMHKNVKMYRYLGFTLGAMLVIVLI